MLFVVFAILHYRNIPFHYNEFHLWHGVRSAMMVEQFTLKDHKDTNMPFSPTQLCFDTLQLQWSPLDEHTSIPETLRETLHDSGSMTQRLKSLCNDKLAVEVFGHTLRPLQSSEKTFFSFDIEECIVRDVILHCSDKPTIFARSFFPVASLTQCNAPLNQLGSRSLGDFLFKQQNLQRSPFAVSCINGRELQNFLPYPTEETDIWIRRSTFNVNESDIVVVEFFLLHP